MEALPLPPATYFLLGCPSHRPAARARHAAAARALLSSMPSSAPPPFTLRTVTSADYAWLWNLKRITMRPYVELTWGNWDETSQEQFFRHNFSPATTEIIVCGHSDAGLLNVEREPSALFLANIQIHPDFQGCG